MNENLLMDIYNGTKSGDDENSLLSNLKVSQNRYIELKEISSGGMKTIYTCVDSHTDREIVLLSPKDPDLNELFIREGFINAYLQHPNISPVYDIGHLENDKPYFTSKLISGLPLNEINYDKGNDQIIDIVIKICEAISYAHSRSIIHQDLKPDNIMIDNFGEVIIIDWGLAEIDDSMISGDNSILDKEMHKLKHYSIPDELKKLRGTPGFIAPERYQGSQSSVSNDIYSIGALLYSKISGQELGNKSLEFPKELPASIKAICEKALDENPSNRYQSAKELLEDLQRYRHGYATQAESASLLRILSLLYNRNKRFCLLAFFAFIAVTFAMILSFALVNQSKNVALVEKEKALQASEKNLQLLETLQSKEESRRHFMRLSAKNQLLKIRQLLKQHKLEEIEILLDSTLKLDPDSKENNIFKAQFELASLRFNKASEVYKDFDLKHPFDTVKSLSLKDSNSILSKMPQLAEFIPNDIGSLFTRNCINHYDNLGVKSEFYEWLIFFSHPGMKRMPKVVIEEIAGDLSIRISGQFAIKECGPIHILDPVHVDLSNSNFLKIFALTKCKNIESLNLSNTPLISLSNFESNTLKKLNLSKTVIKNLLYENFPRLEYLNVAHSSFKQLKPLSNFKNLKTLVVDKSQAAKMKKNTDFKIIVEN